MMTTSDELRLLTKGWKCGVITVDVDELNAIADELDRLTLRVVELEAPQDKWPVVDERDGHQIAACPLCGTEHVVGDDAE